MKPIFCGHGDSKGRKSDSDQGTVAAKKALTAMQDVFFQIYINARDLEYS